MGRPPWFETRRCATLLTIRPCKPPNNHANFFRLTLFLLSTIFLSLARGGAPSRGDPEGGARGGARGRGSHHALGRPRDPIGGQYDPSAGSLLDSGLA